MTSYYKGNLTRRIKQVEDKMIENIIALKSLNMNRDLFVINSKNGIVRKRGNEKYVINTR